MILAPAESPARKIWDGGRPDDMIWVIAEINWCSWVGKPAGYKADVPSIDHHWWGCARVVITYNSLAQQHLAALLLLDLARRLEDGARTQFENQREGLYSRLLWFGDW